MQVIADVDEADIGGVQEGQRVIFTVDAYPNDTFEGTVTQVRLEATEESNVVTYEVVISAHNPDLKLKPGNRQHHHLHRRTPQCREHTAQSPSIRSRSAIGQKAPRTGRFASTRNIQKRQLENRLGTRRERMETS